MILPMTNVAQPTIRNRTEAREERRIHAAETPNFTGASERTFYIEPFCGMNAALRRSASRTHAPLS